MLEGAAAIAMPSASRRRPQVAQTITALMIRLTTGSSHSHPLNVITKPATTTPADASASEAIWTNAPRRLMSRLPPANSQAVRPLITIPTAATIITVFPATGSGAPSLLIASHEIAPTITSRNAALNSAARMDEPRRP